MIGIPKTSTEPRDCGCGAPATMVIVDASPNIYACGECVVIACEYALAVNRLNKMVRDASIPGSKINASDIEAATYHANRMEKRMYGRGLTRQSVV